MKDIHKYVAVDVETGGLSVLDHDIVSIAMVWEGGSMYSLVKPLLPVDPEAASINGYDKEKWKNAATLADLAPVIAAILKGRTIVAHNATFDCKFLSETATRQGADIRVYHSLCTAQLAKEHLNLHSVSLSSVCEHLKIKLDSHHNALCDAQACFEIFKRLWKKGSRR